MPAVAAGTRRAPGARRAASRLGLFYPDARCGRHCGQAGRGWHRHRPIEAGLIGGQILAKGQRSCAALAVRGNPRSPKVKETVGAFVQACVGPFPPAVGAYRRRRPNRWVLLTYEWRRRWISEWTVDGFASGLGLLLAHKLAEDSTSRLPHGTGRVNPPLA